MNIFFCTRDDDKEQLNRRTVVNEPHDCFRIGPVQPEARMGQCIEEVVERQRDVGEEPDDALDHGPLLMVFV